MDILKIIKEFNDTFRPELSDPTKAARENERFFALAKYNPDKALSIATSEWNEVITELEIGNPTCAILELADFYYALSDTLYRAGILDLVVDAVALKHTSNMTKLPASGVPLKDPETGKILKGELFVPVDEDAFSVRVNTRLKEFELARQAELPLFP